jgi:hypothetical protein
MKLRTRAHAALSVALLAATTLAATPAWAKAPEVYPLAKVKRGMKGYGLTVFQGTTPERFEFEVIGVMHNFLPGMDVILFKSDDPKMTPTGTAAGMSGSPMFIDGKVVCALSYSVANFNKASMGGCTPLETMVAESQTPLRGMDSTALASLEDWQRYQPLDAAMAQAGVLSAPGARPDAWLTASPLPTVAPAATGQHDGATVARASVPLSLSGLGPRAFAEAQAVFGRYGLEPMQAGGAGDENGGPTKFEMGGAIGIKLITGDMSAAATGTVSYVDGDNVLAFGHPMFQMGEVYMPVSAAEVHVIVPSAQRPYKLSSPLRTLGTLVQDRQSMIQASTSKQIDMIPIDITIDGPAGQKQIHTKVARNRFLTPQLVIMSVLSGAGAIYPDVADAVVTVESTIQVHGFKPLTFTDYVYSSDGVAGNAIASARALRVLSPILFNPWKTLTLDRMEFKVAVRFEADYANIVDLRVPASEVPYGKPFDVEVALQPFAGKPYTLKIPVTLPARLAGQVVRLEVLPGDMARLDIAAPENTEQLMDALRKTYPGNVVVVTVYTAD